MNRDASLSATSLQIARRLLARDGHPAKTKDPDMVGASLQETCVRVLDNLRDTMGEDGCTALLARALARTEGDHPVLRTIRGLDDGRIHLDGVVASVKVHGVAAVAAAIEGLLAALVDILGRLIGEDMAIRLIDYDAPRPPTGGGAQAP